MSYLAANLMLLPGLLPIEPILVVAWSLSYEAFFYVTLAVLVMMLALYRHSRTTRVLVIGSAALSLCMLYGAGVNVPIRMLPFFAGMLLYEIEAIGFVLPPALALIAPALAFLAGAALWMPSVLREIMHTAAFLVLCAACFSGQNIAAAVFSWLPLRWLGNMSYSYYLVHGFAVTLGALAMARFGGHSLALFLISLPILFAVSVVPAAVLFITVEKPISLAPRCSAT
jgi:exopolysaccharide production protein ExoZ